MILNTAPQAEAVLSNVGEIGEFRIRNSAKAFNILSSGLYANKIKAIIRELSCNAIDSHTSAGQSDPFELHLPTTLEPWFAIRDFGTGLDHEQVTSIYTTYFESTKTTSNEFIGALGLGSKSPFSYTDNFTVTAIKNGRKGVYTAFINDVGVPAIAMMCEEPTDEKSGVEVKFSVNDRHDFHRFTEESKSVFSWFPVKPVFTGQKDFQIVDNVFESADIVPGVHALHYNGFRASSIAIMGNIAYPIDVPQKEQALEGVAHLLSCNLVMHFKIGELDFQASREGLSYIPLTINSIREKLKSVKAALHDVIAKEADAISCKWKKSKFLHQKKTLTLWKGAVDSYVNSTGFELFDVSGRWSNNYTIKLSSSTTDDLNISIKGFISERHTSVCANIKPHIFNDNSGNFIDVPVDYDTVFIENDTKLGILERAKFHYRQKNTRDKIRENVYVLSPIDKTKPMDLIAFYAAIHNPPVDQRMVASKLEQKTRVSNAGLGKNVKILKLTKRGGHRNTQASRQMIWSDDVGALDVFETNKTYYYVPLKSLQPIYSIINDISINDLYIMMKNSCLDDLRVDIFGVRKGDLDNVKTKKNWVNIENYITDTLKKNSAKIFAKTVRFRLADERICDYNKDKVLSGIKNDLSPSKMILKILSETISNSANHSGIFQVNELMRMFGVATDDDFEKSVVESKKLLQEFNNRYPLIAKFNHSANEEDVYQYVNLIDEVKGV